ncbi:secreted protein [Streptomyces zinciresistens K42]|uniref:Secreted protein n=1 Tax=Streptomyces zinciresistens K42 TaxID=700597 RepID=G2GDP8_9ACTN|nr:hypothetical protein [Streptomyces zinciresistens]EGX58384.1 secreted protein [Streptomyces zinciresistens K42]
MSWTRNLLGASAVCVLVLAGSVGCGTDDARGRAEEAPAAPAGKVLDDTDDQGRRYREVAARDAPEVGIEVQPDPRGGGGTWDVRLTVRRFRFSPADAEPRAVAGRGTARLFVDGRPVTELRAPAYRLPASLVPRGTHQVTVRLYADDGTVWAVDADPVQSTADVTASQAGEGAPPRGSGGASGTCAPPGGRCAPGRAGEAS